MYLTTTKTNVKVHKRSKRLKRGSMFRINNYGESKALSKHFVKLRKLNEDNQPLQNIPWVSRLFYSWFNFVV